MRIKVYIEFVNKEKDEHFDNQAMHRGIEYVGLCIEFLNTRIKVDIKLHNKIHSCFFFNRFKWTSRNTENLLNFYMNM